MHRRTLLPPTIGLLTAVAPLCAGVQAQEPTELAPVTITGSRIPQLQNQTANPTLVLRRSDIVRSGVNSLKALVDALTGSSQTLDGANSNKSLSDLTGQNSFAAGSSSVSLRNLGHQSTLVLLNSRRVASFAIDDAPGMFVNLDTLPLDAIDRIEILRSGGSALYGSDAIAGVINIITRQDYRGVQARASHEQSIQSSAFHTSTAALTAGLGDDDPENRYHLLLNLELFKRSSVAWREVLDQVNPELHTLSPSFGSPSTYSRPGNVNGQAVAGCPTLDPQNGLCVYDRYARMQAQPGANRMNWLISGEWQLQPQLTAFSELLYGQSQTRYFAAPTTYGTTTLPVWFSPQTGQMFQFNQRGLPKEHPLNPTGFDDTEFRHRFTEVDNTFVVDTNNYRLLIGLKGSPQPSQWEIALGTMGGSARQKLRGALSDSGFKTLIGDYNQANDPLFFNRGYHINQPNTAQTLNTLFPDFSLRGKTTQTFLDGKWVGSLPPWRGRKIGMAAGFDLRHETLRVTPSQNLATGDVIGQGSAQTDGARTFAALFGELNLAWSPQLELQAAARLDHYPSFATHLTPKVGMRLTPSAHWLWRATLEGGFRAPNLTESTSANRYAFLSPIQDPKRCPQAQTLAKNLLNKAQNLPDTDPQKIQLQSRADLVLAQECAGSITYIQASNPHLQPEKSRAINLGTAFSPSTNYIASLDYWAILRRNEINYKSPQDLLGNENNLPIGIINRLPAGQDKTFTNAERAALNVQAEPLSYTFSQLSNTHKTFTSGLDLSVQTRTLTPLGTLTGDIQATYLIDFRQFSPLRANYGDNLAGRYGYPRWRSALSAVLSRGPLSHALRVNFTSGTSLRGDFYDELYTAADCAERGWSANHCRIKSYTTLDYGLSYTHKRQLTLHLQIHNLLNQRPPLDLRGFFENGAGLAPQNLSDAQGRTFKLALEYKL